MSDVNVRMIYNVCDVEALKVKARLARLHSLRHLDASPPASSANNSSLLPEISMLSFESNTHNLVLLFFLCDNLLLIHFILSPF